MSVLIKEMEMPICRTCPCVMKNYTVIFCKFTGEVVPLSFDRGEKCPLVEVPTPHGRLIDAEVVFENIMNNIALTNGIPKAFEDTPTVIESEE